MSIQPAHQSTPPGWYPDPTAPGTQRYWDGRAWTENRAPLPQPMQQPSTVVQVGQPRHVSGISTGGHIVHITLSVVTLGLWLPFYALFYWLSRKRIT
jgi:hypothetical protein